MADDNMEGSAKGEKKDKGKKRQSTGDAESKEAKRARKEAKKKAMTVNLGVSEPGPSSSTNRLVSSKSELEVARMLDPDQEDQGDPDDVTLVQEDKAAETVDEGHIVMKKQKSKEERKLKKVKKAKAKVEDDVDSEAPANGAEPQSAAIRGDGAEEIKEKKKKEKGKRSKEEEVVAGDIPVGIGAGEKGKKKKDKKAKLVQGDEVTVDGTVRNKKEKRKGKSKVDTDEFAEEHDEAVNGNGFIEPSKKARKKKDKTRKAQEVAEEGQEDAVSDGKKEKSSKEKKEKKRKRTEEVEPPAEALNPSKSEKKKSKKSKTLDGSVTVEDITTDESLSDSAKKALIYVHQHSTSHLDPSAETKWKFNKASQNWLVKHVWEIDQVPETYLGSVVGYLKTISGKGRAHLIEVAKKHSQSNSELKVDTAAASEQVEKREEADEDVQVTVETVSAPKRVGFAETVEGQTQEAQDEGQDDDEVERGRVRAERGKAILKSLGAR